MDFETVWLDEEKTILCQRYLTKMTSEVFYKMADASVEALATVDHPVDVIVDNQMGFDMRGFASTASHVNRIVPPNQRLVVVVTPGRVLGSVAGLVRKIAPKATENLHFVNSVEEAMEFIHTYRQQLASQACD